MPTTAAYLGSSAPVHATHTRLVRSLLDDGHEHVFIFLLSWSPDRAGTTAEAGAAQLGTWLLGFPAADRSRVHLSVVKSEGDGAAKMRSVLGAGAAPEVEVCFSQKYAGQQERIQSQWLPLYQAEFPSAKPRFLSDETDPGGAHGTPAFVDALAAYREAGETADAMAALERFRPEQETAEGWAAYVHGLLHGANGDPLYTPAQCSALQADFFKDTAVLQALDATWRTQKIPKGGAAAYFLKDNAANAGGFWKTMAVAADAALFKRFCLRAQGVTVPSALEAMPPVSAAPPPPPPPAGSAGGQPRRYAVLAAAAMHSTAERLVTSDAARFVYFPSKWRKFPDGTDNITLGGFDEGDGGGGDRFGSE